MGPIVVIRPQSGYINRLQAIVSAQLMAKELGGQLLVDWEPSPITPVGMDAVLSADFCDRYSISSEEASSRIGLDVRSISRYLQFDERTGAVTLAGMDQGEQHFMPPLRSLLATGNVSAIAISAGGKFTLSGGCRLTPTEQEVFRLRRHALYRALSLQKDVEVAADQYVTKHGEFLALHLRYSDRALESPWQARIAPALRRLHEDSGVSSLFIASDTRKDQDHWIQRAPSLGLRPWCVQDASASRMDVAGAHGAMLDWRLLTRAQASVYFASSSFAEEAAVASGAYSRSIGLRAGPERIVWNKSRKLARDAITYPRRLLERLR